VQNGLGATLRRARNRRGLSLVEVEDAIKIRVGLLKAIEEEDWEALPGGSYARGFVRTYAAYLGLDAERLADEYQPRSQVPEAALGRRGGGWRLPRGAVPATVILGLAAIAITVGVTTGGGSGPARTGSQGPKAKAGPGPPPPPAEKSPRGVSLKIAAKAEVWVCVVDAKGRPLVEGQVLPAGAEEGPFHSGSFTVAFGNGEVAMQVDGERAEVSASASPLGYAIDSSGDLKPLSEAQRPTCL
jgi:transcriptional regulator with XRE-family HTH domain